MHALLLRARGQGRTILCVATIFVGALALLLTSNPHYPIEHWLLWHYLALVGLAAFALTAAWSLGDFILRRGLRLTLPTHERAAIGLAVGLTGFELAMFLLGCLNAYGSVVFVGLPTVLILLSVTEGRNLFRRVRRVFAQGRRLTPLELCSVLFGFTLIVLIYLSILTPSNVQFDARWKHMALAEDYVAHGGLRRMPEGWVFSARPNLTSYLYIWAFSIPFGTLFHRMELCAHLEFVVFLVTTFCGVPALVRRLVPEADPRLVWVTRFLFPGVLLYDSSLSAGIDHFGALLAPAIAIATMRVTRSFEWRWVIILTTLLSSAILVKETVAIMLVPVPLAALVISTFGWSGVRTMNGYCLKQRLITTATAGCLGIVLTAPFWLKNVIWYGNPVYPSLGSFFPSTPWSATAAYRFEIEYSETNMWAPERSLPGLLRSLIAIFDFSFIPNNWARFHGHRPVFGSLFTLLLPLLLVLRDTRRLWAQAAWIHIALFSWYWVHHQDRYLQAIMPLMAATTAGILLLSFRQLRRVVKAFVVGLIGVQLALGADVFFIATHAMTGSAIKRTIEILGMGHQGKFAERFVIEPRYVALSRLVPKDSRILFHDMQSHLGSEREAVRDVALWQSGINYSQAQHPNDIHRVLKSMGVTHLVVNGEKSTGGDRLSSDLLFLDFAYRRTTPLRNIDGLRLFALPDSPVSLPFNAYALLVTCTNDKPVYSMHHLADLSRPAIGPLSRKSIPSLAAKTNLADVVPLLHRVDFVVAGSSCEVAPELDALFRKVAERPKRGTVPACKLFIRRAPEREEQATYASR